MGSRYKQQARKISKQYLYFGYAMTKKKQVKVKQLLHKKYAWTKGLVQRAGRRPGS